MRFRRSTADVLAGLGAGSASKLGAHQWRRPIFILPPVNAEVAVVGNCLLATLAGGCLALVAALLPRPRPRLRPHGNAARGG